MFLWWTNATWDLVPYLERVISCEKCHKWHVKDRDARADHPHFEIQAAEPVLLHWPRLDNKQPKAQLCRTQRRQYRDGQTVGASENRAFTFKMSDPRETN